MMGRDGRIPEHVCLLSIHFSDDGYSCDSQNSNWALNPPYIVSSTNSEAFEFSCGQCIRIGLALALPVFLEGQPANRKQQWNNHDECGNRHHLSVQVPRDSKTKDDPAPKQHEKGSYITRLLIHQDIHHATDDPNEANRPGVAEPGDVCPMPPKIDEHEAYANCRCKSQGNCFVLPQVAQNCGDLTA